MSASWERHGAQILEGMVKREPTRFADLCSRLIPKDVAISIEQRLPGGLSPDDWQLMLEVMGAIKQALPTANQQQPGEVMQYVLEALNAHSAPLIEDSRDSD